MSKFGEPGSTAHRRKTDKLPPTVSKVLLRCPVTRQSFQVEITASILAKIWDGPAQVGCDCCGGSHEMDVNGIFLGRALNA